MEAGAKSGLSFVFKVRGISERTYGSIKRDAAGNVVRDSIGVVTVYKDFFEVDLEEALPPAFDSNRRPHKLTLFGLTKEQADGMHIGAMFTLSIEPFDAIKAVDELIAAGDGGER